jgi:hypothetical protein
MRAGEFGRIDVRGRLDAIAKADGGTGRVHLIEAAASLWIAKGTKKIVEQPDGVRRWR